jgi:hypothetical protein
LDEGLLRWAWAGIHPLPYTDSYAVIASWPGGIDGIVKEVKRWYEKGILSEP